MKSFQLICFLALISCSTAKSQEPSVIFLVRHAETVFSDDPDRDLNAAGRDRAELLKRTLQSAGITEVYSTDRKRTINTAKPLADLLGLEIAPYDGRDLEAFAKELKLKTGRILISGHSNTTPELVNLLGGDAGDPINEQTQFDRIYVLHLNGDQVTTTLLKYGANYD
ncbi:MAG: phosphoglycerate mutase family protein [Cyclobacteriaceae bacterium]